MKFFLASYGGAHVNSLIPIIKVLEERGVNYEMLALTAASPLMDKLNIKHKKITDYVKVDDPLIRKYGEILFEGHHNSYIGITENESIAYLGSNFLEIVETYGEEQAYRIYKKEGINSFFPLKLAMRVLEEESPDILITTESPRMESALLRAASLKGINNFCILVLFPFLFKERLIRNDYVKNICVVNEKIKKLLIEFGRTPETVFVTGNPGFDLLYEEDPIKVRNTLRRKMRLNDHEKLVLWIDRPEQINSNFLNTDIKKEISTFCLKRNDYKSCIRFHPNSNSYETEAPFDFISLSDEPLKDILLAADIVISMTSTAGYEALLLNKKTIIVKGSDYDACVAFDEHDGAYVIASFQEIPQAILDIQDDRKSEVLEINRLKLPTIGCATINLLKTIECVYEGY